MPLRAMVGAAMREPAQAEDDAMQSGDDYVAAIARAP